MPDAGNRTEYQPSTPTNSNHKVNGQPSQSPCPDTVQHDVLRTESCSSGQDAFALHSRAWLVVGLLWFVGCLNYLDRVMITTMRRSVIEAIPMNEAEFGLLTSAFLWTYALLSPFAGFLADRYSRSRVIVVSLFCWSVVTWLTAHSTTYWQL